MAKKWIELSGNLVFWLFTGLIIITHYTPHMVIVETIDGHTAFTSVKEKAIFTKLLTLLGISCLLFYTNFHWVMGLVRGKKLPSIILKSLLLFVAANFVFNIFQHHLCDIHQKSVSLLLSSGILIFYHTASVTYAIGKIWLITENKNRQLELEKKQAELTLLRSQLHPHFLFNVLNNLLSMVNQKENPALAAAFERLSGLLRYVVVDTADEKIPIRKEIEFIRNFAELHALRFEKEELDFQLTVLGTNDLQLIEPAIFIPFIENAFKYGVEPEKISIIRVIFDLTDSRKIKFRCINPIHETMQRLKGSGLGIESSQKRLNLVYPHRHRLEINRNGNFEVLLEIEI
ncbi:MAG: histidine kinase [Spirosomataceae bacterium]